MISYLPPHQVFIKIERILKRELLEMSSSYKNILKNCCDVRTMKIMIGNITDYKSMASSSKSFQP